MNADGKVQRREDSVRASPCSIGDYAIIGDCRSAALISRHGSLDWLCWPSFDSPSIFASILDERCGGYWQICPTGPFDVSREYLGRTNVLETRFETSSGILLFTDFKPVANGAYKRSHFSGRVAGAGGVAASQQS